MSTTRVQFNGNAASGVTSLTVTLGSATTAGNLIAVMVSVDGGASPPAAPTGITLVGSSDTFADDAGATSTNPVASVNLSAWSDPSCSGGHTQVTATTAVAAGILLLVWEVAGAATSSPLAGQHGAGNPSNTLQASFDSGAGASSPAGSFWVGAVTGIGSGGRAQAVPGGSWTTEAAQQPGSVTQMLGAYQAGAATGTPEYAGSFSGPVAGAYWASLAVAYKPVAAPVANRGLLMASII